MYRTLAVPKLVSVAVAAVAMVGLVAGPAVAAPARPAPARPAPSAPPSAPPVADLDAPGHQSRPLTPADVPPRPGFGGVAGASRMAAAPCVPADFGSKTDAALVSFVRAADLTCLGKLFDVTGADAYNIFREAQMVTVATAYRDAATAYPGDNSTNVLQLQYFLHGGYWVQSRNASVGSYGTALRTALDAGLDAFVANGHFSDAAEAHAQVLDEWLIIVDWAQESGRYQGAYQRILNGYAEAAAGAWLRKTVDDLYGNLWRAHSQPAFLAAFNADPGVADGLRNLAYNNRPVLAGGGASALRVINAARELSRLLDQTASRSRTRPLAKGLVDATSLNSIAAGAGVWGMIAKSIDWFDGGNCAYYGTCDYATRLAATALPTTHACDAGHTVRAQDLTPAQLTGTCTSVRDQDAYFHTVVADSGPVAGDLNTNIELVIFDNSANYQAYAYPIFGIDINNGGMYLEGTPSAAGNQPRFLAFEDPRALPVIPGIWNLNHEYTHYLDGRFDMSGDFSAGQVVPDIWWVEGFAEYVSYSYRHVDYTAAITQAGNHTYALSTLWQTTYANTNQTRTYNWGYLAVRYMLEKHRSDVLASLAKFRVGDYAGGYAYYNSTIGTRYDADFDGWLTACNAGACASADVPPPACTDPDIRALGRDCSRADRSATTGNLDYLFLYLPAGSTTLTVSTSGGTGNPDLYYNPAGWATPSAYTARSTNAGTTETLTVSNTTAGYRYISLYAVSTFTGVTVTVHY
ncbi:protease [Longispora fulva]|uniref:microbial collagenase n=1 Tax=Longispora fulva TaxID=619741 RepID=A0A8J7GDY7_9ACTN|nr:M9 family metallopeptidase [Longispora fulva]MBG6136929.1 microbial collagenase [Longispora fulva]GIG61718.1 protease [Longispora fulva]